MSLWPEAPLLEVARLSRGMEPGSVTYTDSARGIRFLRVGDITGKTDNPVFTDSPQVVLVNEQDILLTLDGSPGHVSTGHKGAISSGIRRVEPIDPGKVYPAWLKYSLMSPSVQETIRRHTTGVTIVHASAALPYIRIPLPPPSTQRRIAKLLDEAEALQRLRRDAGGRTDNLVAAVFREMFGDPSTNPKAWQMERVGDLMLMCEYGTSRKASETGQGIPILRMNNVRTDGSLDLSELKTVELDEAERAKFRLQEGDVLFNRTNSRELVGKTGLWDGRFVAVAASYFIRVRFDPNREHPQHFTTFMNLPFMKRQLMKMARGAVGQANINAQELKAIQLPVPTFELQRIFAVRVAEIRELQSAQAASRQRLDGLFQSLLHRALQGEP